jgi:hypothetical protein
VSISKEHATSSGDEMKEHVIRLPRSITGEHSVKLKKAGFDLVDE